MRVVINGAEVELGDRPTVADAVRKAGVDDDARGVAAAVAGEVVPRAGWAAREIRDGESVEVVHAVQGG